MIEDEAVPAQEAPPAGTQPALPLSGTEKPVDAPKPTLGAAAQEGEGSVETPKGWYGDDWRERIAGDDEKKLSQLKRYLTLENYLNRTDKLQKELSAGRLKPVLGEDASESEIVDYRKAHGIPDEPSAEGYGVKWPDGYEASSADTADLNAFLGEMHSNHIPTAAVQTVWKAYLGIQTRASEDFQIAAELKTDEHKAEVRGKYMNDKGRFDRLKFDRDVRLGNNFLADILGDERAQQLTALTLADGTKVGDHPLFFEAYTGGGLRIAGDDVVMGAESSAGGFDPETRYKQLLDMQFTDVDKWRSPQTQSELMRLAAAKAAKQNRAA